MSQNHYNSQFYVEGQIFYRLPPFILQGENPSKYGAYTGCGCGYVVIDKKADAVVKMSYSFDGLTPVTKQNINLSEHAGLVLEETETYKTVVANFSCCTACLF